MENNQQEKAGRLPDKLHDELTISGVRYPFFRKNTVYATINGTDPSIGCN